MRIGIDARMLGPRQGGLGRYAEQLVKHLEKIDRQNEYVVFLRAQNWNDYTPATPNFRKVMADIAWYGFAEQTKLPRLLRKEKLDLMHFPHWNVPLFYNAPFVVTIHDLILLNYPTRRASTLGPMSYILKKILFRLVLHHAVAAARAVVTVSQFSKNDIVKHLKIAPEKISVTYLAASPERQSVNGIGESILEKLKISKPYLLYVGVAYPHKNLEKLLDAWKIFKQTNPDYRLVLAGEQNYFYERLARYAERRAVDGVIFAGFVPDNELPALYREAALYVFPSLYEGFGIPPLEAMRYGVPAAVSNRSCLPEVLKEAAEYFDPNNAEAMATAFEKILRDENARARLTKAAEKIIHSYSWENTAKATWEIYKKVV